jgi:ATP dependent DNA ligase domain
MPKFEFCIPTVGKAVPAGAEWFHEIKHDGYRLRVERDGDRVRLITRGGYEWSKRFPWIVEAALKNRRKQFVIDGEAVVLGVDGVSDFDGLRSGKHDAEVQLYAFDCLALDGDNLRKLPLSLAKPTSRSCWNGDQAGSSSHPSSKAKSALICSARLANLDSRGWFPNIGTAPIAPARRRTGSRSRP